GAKRLDGVDLEGPSGRDEAGEDAGEDEDAERLPGARQRELGILEHREVGAREENRRALDEGDAEDEAEVSGGGREDDRLEDDLRADGERGRAHGAGQRDPGSFRPS